MILFSNAQVSPQWKLNMSDIQKIFTYTAVFLAPAILIYLGQIEGELNQNHIIMNFAPNLVTIGAIEGWAIGIIINVFLKLKDGQAQ